jgi:RPA family protein
MAEGESSRRQVAHKVNIADILNNRYVKEDGWLPNYFSVGEKKVSRVNILGVIVSKDMQEGEVASQNFVLDDGSGRISLRFFESGARVDVGDIVLVIGRPREFGTDRYIVPEIVKKVKDSGWVQVRKLELAFEKHKAVQAAAEKAPAPPEDKLDVDTEDFTDDSNPLTRVVRIIKQQDSGDGVGFDDISVKFGEGNVDSFIKSLLEQGDIFEVKPGRYKVLE